MYFPWLVGRLVGTAHKSRIANRFLELAVFYHLHLSTKKSTQGYTTHPTSESCGIDTRQTYKERQLVTPVHTCKCIYLMDTSSANDYTNMSQLKGQDCRFAKISSSPVRTWSRAVERLALPVQTPPHGEWSCNTNLMDSRWLRTRVFVVLVLAIFH